MIPVYQTLTVENDGSGNCRNACIASILERPLRDVADIRPSTDGDWHQQWRVWLADQGYELYVYNPEHPPRGYSIACGKTDRVYPESHLRAGKKISHAVVAFDGVVVHDPFPIPSKVFVIEYFEKLELLPPGELKLHQVKREAGICIHGYFEDCDHCQAPL